MDHYKDLIKNVAEVLERAKKYNLEAEVVTSALIFMATEERYRNNATQALEDACKEWDI